MKRFLVISDTHGRANDAINVLLPLINSCEFIVHLGDGMADLARFASKITCPIHYVKGNCDCSLLNRELVLDLGCEKVLFAHGDLYRVKNGDYLSLSLRAQELGCNSAMFGHTHISEITYYNGVRLVNPGSLGKPWNASPSYAVGEYDENTLNIKIVSI